MQTDVNDMFAPSGNVNQSIKELAESIVLTESQIDELKVDATDKGSSLSLLCSKAVPSRSSLSRGYHQSWKTNSGTQRKRQLKTASSLSGSATMTLPTSSVLPYITEHLIPLLMSFAFRAVIFLKSFSIHLSNPQYA